MDEQGTDSQGNAKGGLTGHLKKHWYLYAAGFGVAILVIYIIQLKNQANTNAANLAASTTPVDTSGTGSNSVDPNSLDSISSMLEGLNSSNAALQQSENQNASAIGQLGTQFAASQSQLAQSFTSAEGQIAQAIQQLASGQAVTTPPPVTSDPTTGSGTPSGLSIADALAQPAPSGTAGMSNNFWVYTTQPGDTLETLTEKFNWTPQQQQGGGPAFTYNYRNNAAVFGSEGISASNPNAAIPVGTRISA